MATTIIDLSGQAGLTERHQGDLNDSASSPSARYTGANGQVADGIFNPLKKLGYISAANAVTANLTGTISEKIVAIEYDEADNNVYYATENNLILNLDGFDDSSLTTYQTLTSGLEIKDMVIYEVNGKKSLVYAIDKGTGNGMSIGFKTLNPADFALTVFATNLPDTTAGSNTLIYATGSVTISDNPRRLAQSFNTSSLAGLEVTGAMMRLKRVGTGTGITLRMSLRASATKSSSPYTDRGTWATATSYAVRDTVTRSGVDYVCYAAHTSGSTTEPGLGADWLNNWRYFNSPTDTDLAYGDFVLSTVTDGTGGGTTWEQHEEIKVQFNTKLTLTASTRYWLVLSEVGSNMTVSDQVSWVSTNNAGTTLTTQYYVGYTNTLNLWRGNGNASSLVEGRTAECAIYTNDSESWTSDIANGAFEVESGQDTYLYLAENGLLYWFTNNTVHALDGSIVGGDTGRVIENTLLFPSYVKVVGVAETRSKMYIAIQSSEKTNTTSRAFTASRCGVFVWDRRSQVLGSTDFLYAPGAKQILNIFTSSTGDVLLLTIGNEGFSEIRAISGNQYAVIQTFERTGYPNSRRGISQLGLMSVWLGKNGIFYGYGSTTPGTPSGLFKLGKLSSLGTNFESGPLIIGDSNTTPRSAVLFSYKNDTANYAGRWFPNGEGTIASINQTGEQGDIYSLVNILPHMSTLKYVDIRCLPCSGTGSTTLATIKYYINQSTTPFMTKTITADEAARGYIRHELNKPFVNTFQMEIEYPTSLVLGTNNFYPYTAVLDYEATNTIG